MGGGIVPLVFWLDLLSKDGKNPYWKKMMLFLRQGDTAYFYFIFQLWFFFFSSDMLNIVDKCELIKITFWHVFVFSYYIHIYVYRF